MNFVFVSPQFPHVYWQFCAALRRDGARVLGVGDTPFDALAPEVRDSLDEYYWVHDLENYEEDDLPAPDSYVEEQNSEGNQQEKRENAAQASCCEIDEKKAQKRAKREEEPKKGAKGGIPENWLICRICRTRGKK